jgi:EAL domain-containing protein (putative c-di-GMP-specific phosphodiesterase class I)
VATAVLNDLIGRGFQISLDDFGTGFSSLTNLRHLPAAIVKIDKSFVLSLGENAADAHMVSGTIELAHRLGKRVVAEGVETERARDMLSGWGCEYAQGYLWSRPLPGSQVLDWASDRHCRTSIPRPRVAAP